MMLECSIRYFFIYSLFVGDFGIKGFFRSFFVVDVLWVYSLSGGFFRFSMSVSSGPVFVREVK